MSAKVKICGIKDSQTALFCADNGADFIGLNFSPASPRCIDIPTAEKIMQYVRNTDLKIVFLFFKNSQKEILKITEELQPNYIQYITREWSDTNFLMNTHIPLIASLQVEKKIENMDLKKWPAEFFILDSYSSIDGGGTGKTFNYNYIENISLPYLLAGGLNPENVADALHKTSAFGVDVASGVEKSKGLKDNKLIERFIQNAKRK